MGVTKEAKVAQALHTIEEKTTAPMKILATIL